MSGVILPRRTVRIDFTDNFHNPSSSKHLLLRHNARVNPEYQSQWCHVVSMLLRVGLTTNTGICISKIASTNVETLPVICASSRAARTLPRSHFQESTALINLRRIFPRAITTSSCVASTSYYISSLYSELTLYSLAIYIVILIFLSAWCYKNFKL